MNAKQIIRIKAANWLANQQPDLEQMQSTESRNRLVDSLFTELIECWMQGISVGANMAIEAETSLDREDEVLV